MQQMIRYEIFLSDDSPSCSEVQQELFVNSSFHVYDVHRFVVIEIASTDHNGNELIIRIEDHIKLSNTDTDRLDPKKTYKGYDLTIKRHEFKRYYYKDTLHSNPGDEKINKEIFLKLEIAKSQSSLGINYAYELFYYLIVEPSLSSKTWLHKFAPNYAAYHENLHMQEQLRKIRHIMEG